jgi:hypothetical protein
MTKTAHTALRRGATIAAATLAAVAAWEVAARLVGVDLAVHNGASRTGIGLGSVVAASLVAGLAAWALLALLETAVRRRAGMVWTMSAVVVLAGSVLGPLSAVDAASGVTLAALHLVVGTILIVGLRATTRQV